MGYLEYRLKTTRKTLHSSQRKRKAPSSLKKPDAKKSKPTPRCEGSLLEFNQWEEKTYDLKYKTASDENKNEIFKEMDLIRPNRQDEIFSTKEGNAQMSITEILEKYPKFLDYSGELIEREFFSLYPEGDTLIGKFLGTYVPRILKFIEIDDTKRNLLTDFDDLNDAFKALVILPEILPPPNYTRKTGNKSTQQQKKIFPNPALIRFVNAQEDLLHATKAKTSQQPFLICVSIDGNRNSGKFFIRADSKIVDVPRDPMKAFDILLKLHFSFDVEYAPELTNFYNFVTGCIMELEGVMPQGCCASLKTTLLNLQLQDASSTARLTAAEEPAE